MCDFYEAFQHFSCGFQKSVTKPCRKKSIGMCYTLRREGKTYAWERWFKKKEWNMKKYRKLFSRLRGILYLCGWIILKVMIDQGDRSLISQRKGTGVRLCRFVRRRTLCIRYKLDGHCGRPFFVALGQATITDWTDVTSISTYVHEKHRSPLRLVGNASRIP